MKALTLITLLYAEALLAESITLTAYRILMADAQNLEKEYRRSSTDADLMAFALRTSASTVKSVVLAECERSKCSAKTCRHKQMLEHINLASNSSKPARKR